jgi:hypothetical protein
VLLRAGPAADVSRKTGWFHQCTSRPSSARIADRKTSDFMSGDRVTFRDGSRARVLAGLACNCAAMPAQRTDPASYGRSLTTPSLLNIERVVNDLPTWVWAGRCRAGQAVQERALKGF